MQLQKTCTEVVNRVFDLAEVPGEIRLKVRERAAAEVLQMFTRQSIASKLSDRDVEILDLLACGHTAREIAPKVYLSHRTIEHRMTELKRILSCRNIRHMVATAKDLKII